MLEVKRYLSDDGTIFDTREKCQEYEKECQEIAEALAKLKPRPDSTEFTNGGGYVQQDIFQVFLARNRLVEIAQRVVKATGWSQNDSIALALARDEDYAARVISECSGKNLKFAWYRIQSIDNKGREWGQIYFARNQRGAEQIEIA